MNSDRRRYPRTSAHGTAQLILEDASEVSGDVIEISQGGFRMRHEFRGFQEGQRVTFVHPFAKGRARVVWTRDAGPHVETGFSLLDIH